MFFDQFGQNNQALEDIQITKAGIKVLPISDAKIDELVANDPYYSKVAAFFANLASAVDIQVDCQSPQLQADIIRRIKIWKRLFVKAQKKADTHGEWHILIENGDRNLKKPIRTNTKKFTLFISDYPLKLTDDRTYYQLKNSSAYSSQVEIHASRVLTFISRADGESVIRQFHRYWTLYRVALERITGLLVRKDFVTIRREGLKEELEEVDNPDQFLNSILTAGMDAIENQGLLLLDARNVDIEIHGRDLGGVDLVTRVLRNAAVGATGGVPEGDLFFARDKSGNLTSSDRQDRIKQGEITDRIVRDSWIPNLETLVTILGYSNEVLLIPGSSNVPTIDEQIELVRRWAEVDAIYSQMIAPINADGSPAVAVLSLEEIRTRFENGWSQYLVLDPKHPLTRLEQTIAKQADTPETVEIETLGEAEKALRKAESSDQDK